MNTINPLKDELASTISSCRKLEKRVGECQKEVELERETQRVLEKQHISKVSGCICAMFFSPSLLLLLIVELVLIANHVI